MESVERCFSRFEGFRRMVTRDDRPAGDAILGGVHLAAVVAWCPRVLTLGGSAAWDPRLALSAAALPRTGPSR
jgi:hypothetical protein